MATVTEVENNTAATFADSALNEYGPIRRMVVRHARDAYLGQAVLDDRWEVEEFLGSPDFNEALAEYDSFLQATTDAGIEPEFVPADERNGVSAIYVRDSALISRHGAILCAMRNAHRAPEPAVANDDFARLGVPVVGAVTGTGLIEGGDFIWLDENTCAVADGYRTNPEGIRQLGALLDPDVHIEVAQLPHGDGPGACLHLMSLISPLDANLALVYSKLMPVRFRQWLLDRGTVFVEVPDDEYEPTMGCNVLALGPRKCLALDGNPVTRRRMEAAGCDVVTYKGSEISFKGGGGPTCLTRPLIRG
ncbi:MAG: arginine deiminase family protein [Pseudomonadota bacterium]|nr:arginine deiminase family protein [Pseudomonadota bacterium]